MDLSISSMETSLEPSEEEEKTATANGIDLRSSAVTPHTEAVQALKKYLLRKLSSEESSSGDKDFDCTPGKVFSVAELDGSKLYCSMVRKPDAAATDEPEQGQKCLAKHKSLDLDDRAPTRYLRTDLCIPVLWSKCSFCDDFFENEEQLRKHLRDSHFHYFLNYIQMRPLKSTKSLSDLPFSSALKISESPVQSEGDEQFQGAKHSHHRKSVKCQVCQKSFTSKWNCKQHLKCHTRETGAMMKDNGLY